MLNLFSFAGHGGKDGGATSNGVLEKNLTLDIDRRFSETISKQANVKVTRGRTTDVFTEPDARAAKVKNSGADICIDHHINSNAGTPGKGAEVLVSIHSKGTLGKYILEELVKLEGTVSRGVKQKQGKSGDYYYMHRQTGSVETVIIEYGFINNDDDRTRLLQEEYRQQCAQAVANAVLRYKSIAKIDTLNVDLPDRAEVNVEAKPQASKTLLSVDGDWGELTTRELQRHFGTPEDGKISKPSMLIKAIQRVVGAVVDGFLGKETISKMQIYLRTPVDGKISKPSMMVREMQRRLNEGRF